MNASRRGGASKPPGHTSTGQTRNSGQSEARLARHPRKQARATASLPGAMEPAGLAARQLASAIIAGVLHRELTIDKVLAEPQTSARTSALEPRDRAFARMLAATTLRHLGRLRAVVSQYLERPLPASGRRVEVILAAGAAQLLLLKSPAHAAIHLAVEQCHRDPNTRRFAGLVNAVLRRVNNSGAKQLAELDAVEHDIPAWLRLRWERNYGVEKARQIALACLKEAPLDLTLKVAASAPHWAERLGAAILPTGSLRLPAHGPVDELEGYAEGAWWVQDAAAALPARLLGDVRGRTIADLCAAPGGKSAQLAAAGAHVLAVDRSPVRLERLAENARRLGLADGIEAIAADVATWQPAQPLDAIILDAPCTATGTIRRHPDLLHVKREPDVARLASLQDRLLAHAASLLRPGGRLVYCTCSLEPEEGRERIATLLASTTGWERVRIEPAEIGAEPGWITPEGDLRTLPCHLPAGEGYSGGMDGFYAARLERRSIGST